ncbi:hypothetical protein [Flavobacterium sp.]|uniref:hypothetical protein n=1 Tax=Flavobacterium sp. TaxID=239 RepID=UPI0039E6314C
MNKTEPILVIIAILSFLLSFSSIPGQNLLFVFAFMILSILYFWLGFAIFNNIGFRKIFNRESYRNISQSKIIGAVGAGVSISLTMIGILFTAMFWPGSGANLMLGLIGLAVVCIISFIKNSNQKSEYYSKILNRSMIFGIIGIVLMFVPYTMLAEIKYRNDPKYRDALINTIKEPNNEEFHKKFVEESQRREQGQ